MEQSNITNLQVAGPISTFIKSIKISMFGGPKVLLYKNDLEKEFSDYGEFSHLFSKITFGDFLLDWLDPKTLYNTSFKSHRMSNGIVLQELIFKKSRLKSVSRELGEVFAHVGINSKEKCVLTNIDGNQHMATFNCHLVKSDEVVNIKLVMGDLMDSPYTISTERQGVQYVYEFDKRRNRKLVECIGVHR